MRILLNNSSMFPTVSFKKLHCDNHEERNAVQCIYACVKVTLLFILLMVVVLQLLWPHNTILRVLIFDKIEVNPLVD